MDDEAKIITSIIQLQTKKKRNVLDDILTIYENYVVRKVSNEGFSNKVDEVLKNYSIPKAVALGCICSLIEEQKNKKKLLKDINMFLIKDNMYQVINRRIDKLFL
jgi:hypothetical protein